MKVQANWARLAPRRGCVHGVLCLEMLGVLKRGHYALFLLFTQCSGGGGVASPLVVDAGPDVPKPTYTIEQLKDPDTCNQCHTNHYRDWSGSMHAYATDDPLFLAMNAKGQREANIGNFCVNCHAPMAVAAAPTGTIIDNDMLKALPKSERGVTCYFCHNVDSVTDTHNNPLHLAGDNVMRGRFTDAVPNEAHASAYSEFLDGTQLGSARACGSCHDIVNDHGAHIERTFEEWQGTVFATAMGKGLTCAQCHLRQAQPGVIADGPKVQGVFLRLGHAHTMAGVDRALTDFPEIEAQKTAVMNQLNLPPELQTSLCVSMSGSEARIGVLVDNFQAGHKWPSGSAQDRQLWFEVTAYAGGTQIYQSGAVPADGKDPDVANDPDLWLMRDCMFDAQGQQTHMFWEAATFDSNNLPGQITFDPTSSNYYLTHVARAFPSSTSPKITTMPDRVTLKAWVQPFPYEVFDELGPELKLLGYADAQVGQIRAKLAPMQVTTSLKDGSGGVLEWTPDEAIAQATNGSFINSSDIIPVLPAGVQARCVTGTSMVIKAQNVRAPTHTMCKP